MPKSIRCTHVSLCHLARTAMQPSYLTLVFGFKMFAGAIMGPIIRIILRAKVFEIIVKLSLYNVYNVARYVGV